jgi:hypothetical protein
VWRSRELKGFDDFGGGFAFEGCAVVVGGGVCTAEGNHHA